MLYNGDAEPDLPLLNWNKLNMKTSSFPAYLTTRIFKLTVVRFTQNKLSKIMFNYEPKLLLSIGCN